MKNFKLKIISVFFFFLFALFFESVPAFAQNILVNYGQSTGSQTAITTPQEKSHTFKEGSKKLPLDQYKPQNKDHKPRVTPKPMPTSLATLPKSWGIFDSLGSATSYLLTIGHPVSFNRPQQSFAPTVKPSFTLDIPTKDQTNIGKSRTNTWQTTDEVIQAKLVSKVNGSIIPAVIQKTASGQFVVTVQSTEDMPHGDYSLQVDAKESFLYTRNLTQDFSWGVLAVNTNKSIYTPGEKVTFSFAVLNESGGAICNAGIQANITDPQGTVTQLSTTNQKITTTPDCGTDFYTTNPDYIAQFQTHNSGVYHIHLLAQTHNGQHTLDDYFEVKDSVPFAVERTAFPTRIYPAVPYPVKITITANQDYSGDVRDFVPKAFYVEDISGDGTASAQTPLSERTMNTDPNVLTEDAQAYAKYNGDVSKIVHELIAHQTKNSAGETITTYEYPDYTNLDTTPMPIVWHVDWKKGQTYTLSYVINFPPVAINYYLLGPFTVGDQQKPIFQEVRQWQVASDANRCWKGTVDANWNSSNNWVSTTGTAVTLASGDVAIFDSSSTTCSSGSTNNASTINVAETVQGLKILTYTNTITQSNTLSLTNATGYVQSASGSTFTGDNHNITDSGVFTLSAGNFTSTSATMSASSTWNTTGGTFHANGGTVEFTSNSFTITPNSETYNNVEFDDTTACGITYAIASGKTLTVAGTLTLLDVNGSCGKQSITINGAGGISAQGDINLPSVSQGAIIGSAVVTINGTGTQTVTGIATSTDGEGSIMSININKSSGTLNFRNMITEDDNWTWTQGTVDYTGSTVNFSGDDPGTLNGIPDFVENITPGSTAFNNVAFDTSDGSCTANAEYDLANGTTMTVNGSLALAASGSCDPTTIVNGPGGINAKGDISVNDSNASGDNISGSVTITINGTGTQTLSGMPGGTELQAELPSININKSSGTLDVRNNITAINDWTWTQGTVDYTGSTIYFSGAYDGTESITPGATAFNNVAFDDPCDAPQYNLANGTTMTIAGTLTLEDTSGCGAGPDIKGPGGISAQGDISLTEIHGSVTGDAVITINGTGTQTMTGISSGPDGQGNIGSININKPSGTLNFRNNITETNDWTWTQGTVDYTGTTIYFNAAADATESITPGSTAFNNVTFNDICNSPQYTISTGTMTVAGTLTLEDTSNCGSGPAILGPGGISAQGDISLTSTGGNGSSTGVITINGTGTQTMTGLASPAHSYSAEIPSININKPSGTLNIRNTVSETNDWTWTQGTVDYTGSTVDFPARAGTSNITPGATAFNNVTFDDTCNNATDVVASGSTLLVGGNLLIEDTSSCNGPVINGPGAITVQGNITTSSPGNGGPGNIAITLSGSGSQTITQNASDKFPTGNWTIAKSGGTATLASALTLNASGQNLTVSGGTLDLAGNKLIMNTNSVIGMTGGTIKLQGAEYIPKANTSFSGGTVNYYGSGTYAKMDLGTNYYNLTISGSGSWTAATSSAVLGTFSQSAGTYTAPSTLTISGGFSKSGGVFTPNSGAVVFNDNTQTSAITGTNTFYDLSVTTGGKVITFPASATTTISHSLTLQGIPTSRVTLRSSSQGTQWNLNATGSYTLNALDVQDSNACGSSVTPLTTAASFNAGNNSCWSFSTSIAWYNASWLYRKEIVIDHTKVPADQANFPVLITWASDTNVKNHAQSNGNDILFTSVDGVTKLNHEIEKYASSTGELEAWVNVPSLSSTADTVLWMYYGNGSATNQQNVNATWNSSYKSVWHLYQGTTGGAPQMTDSTSNANHGTAQGTTNSNQSVTGEIDGATNLNGTNQWISTTTQLTNPTSFTIQAWFKTSSSAGNYIIGLADSKTGAPSNYDRHIYIGTDGKVYFGVWDGGNEQNVISTRTYNDGNWHQAVAEFSASGEQLFVDGASVGTNTNTTVQSYNGWWRIGYTNISGWLNAGSNFFFNGTLDEVRYSNIALSSSWVQAEYNNIASPSTFERFPSAPSMSAIGSMHFSGAVHFTSN